MGIHNLKQKVDTYRRIKFKIDEHKRTLHTLLSNRQRMHNRTGAAPTSDPINQTNQINLKRLDDIANYIQRAKADIEFGNQALKNIETELGHINEDVQQALDED